MRREGAHAKEVAMYGGVFYGNHSSLGAGYAQISASDARRKASSAQTRSQQVEDRLDRAMLACEAMWSLLRDKLGVTDEMLMARITEIDLSDGKLDRKVSRPVAPCPHCQRPNSSRFNRCVYCGKDLPSAPFA